MTQKDIHTSFRECVPLSLLFAAFEKSFPHFHRTADSDCVDSGGKDGREKVFLALKAFSTSFPQPVVDAERQL